MAPLSGDPNIVTVEVAGQEIELAVGGAYEFGFRFPRRQIVAAYFVRLNGRDLALRTLDGKLFHRSLRDLENIWITPQPGVRIP